MERVTLLNPDTGADIDAQFVAKEDEIRDKEDNVINAKKVVFPAGGTITTDRKTADYILRTWGFVIETGSVTTKPVEEVVEKTGESPEGLDPDPVEVEPEDTGEKFQNAEEEFEYLKSKGFRNLKGEERDKYKELKILLEGENLE